jgi:hypothetical protein
MGAWKDIFKALKEYNCQTRLVYPAKLSSLIEGEIKTFHSKQKLREFITTKQHCRKYLKDSDPTDGSARRIQERISPANQVD